MSSSVAYGLETRTWQVGDAPDTAPTQMRYSELGGIRAHFPHQGRAMLENAQPKSDDCTTYGRNAGTIVFVYGGLLKCAISYAISMSVFLIIVMRNRG